MNSNEAPEVDLKWLVDRVLAKLWLILAIAAAFLILAIGITWVRPELYEATAYLEVTDDRLPPVENLERGEVEDPSFLETVERKLGFLSLFQAVTDDGRDLKKRTRIQGLRGTRLIAVTVENRDPDKAASEANRIVRTFIGNEAGAAVESWTETAESLLKASEAIDGGGTLGLRRKFEQRAEEMKALAEISPAPVPYRMAEQASAPVRPAGPGKLFLWAGALFAGVVVGLFWVWCRPFLG